MQLDFSVISRSLGYLWSGFEYTVELTVIATLGGLFFGTLLAMARLARTRWLASSLPKSWARGRVRSRTTAGVTGRLDLLLRSSLLHLAFGCHGRAP